MRLDNAESNEDFSPSWICWLVSRVLASYISYELLVGLFEGSRSISDESPFSLRGAAAPFLAEDPAQFFSSNLILDGAKRTTKSLLAEDPAKGLTSSTPEVNAYKFQSGDVVETFEKLLLRCRIHVCVARYMPPQPRGDVANVTIDVCGRQGRDGQESMAQSR